MIKEGFHRRTLSDKALPRDDVSAPPLLILALETRSIGVMGIHVPYGEIDLK